MEAADLQVPQLLGGEESTLLPLGGSSRRPGGSELVEEAEGPVGGSARSPSGSSGDPHRELARIDPDESGSGPGKPRPFAGDPPRRLPGILSHHEVARRKYPFFLPPDLPDPPEGKAASRRPGRMHPGAPQEDRAPRIPDHEKRGEADAAPGDMYEQAGVGRPEAGPSFTVRRHWVAEAPTWDIAGRAQDGSRGPDRYRGLRHPLDRPVRGPWSITAEVASGHGERHI